MKTDVRCHQCGAVYGAPELQEPFGGACPRCIAGFAFDGPAEPDPLRPGTVFRGMEVLELLGRGGMGVVYNARQKELVRMVALKLLSPTLADDPEFAQRFTREARVLASLHHPGIVQVYEFGREEGLFYLVME